MIAFEMLSEIPSSIVLGNPSGFFIRNSYRDSGKFSEVSSETSHMIFSQIS